MKNIHKNFYKNSRIQIARANLNYNEMENKKKYLVSFLVWEKIEQEIETEETDLEKIKELAVAKAIEEQPKVHWQVDENDVDLEEQIEEIE